ncbi:uncharacterized protein EV420DRAFT_444285 [Desarmillaria tabescens]|uniref:Protein kinase domain-containing protein n=1 Tax=Armillaria tabescens TaxID=1929756 RepID=A0AA39NM25_ARMTA|nr:uncharacterized protein EV420DRAFT_444285 [Desarmillaria tabescens]KAK0468065.1 hypothetical protein EV420DRAFT_444285 [Desarmillaria tabescens]
MDGSILDEVRNVPFISLDAFQRTVLPKVISPTQIDDITTRLQANGHLQPSGRWTVFPTDPCMETNENTCFKRLETIAAAIVKEAKSLLHRDPTAVMQTRPTQAALSEGRNGQFISDGHYALCESKGARVVSDESSTRYGKPCPYERKAALACDRVAIEEYKLKDTWEDENDNNKKILGNAAQMMYADPCRRFMFGMTIANTTTRLWFFSRAIVLVSEPFDLILEYRHLIHYVVSMSFGSTEDLGYDSSITRVAVPLKASPARYRIQYDYLIDGETYRTVECLSSFRASYISSRATRVWTVRKLGDRKNQECALKDCWIPLASRMESEIQKDIFERIEANDPEAKKDPSLYKQYFMEIKACEVVTRTDKTEDVIPPLSDAYRMYDVKRRLRSSAASKRSTSILLNTADPVGGHLSGRIQQHHPQREYTGCKHVRVLFSEVGTPLDKVQDQQLLFTGLLHASKGLRYLYIASYVHRDISSGNILLCSGKRGKISDLEYAKLFLTEDPKSDPKTGTPIFMAAEVQCKQYLFETTEEDDVAAVASGMDSFFAAQQVVAALGLLPTPFLHNFYHDTESLWWIGVHSLFTTEPPAIERDQDTQQLQREHFNALFSHYAEGSNARFSFLNHPKQYIALTSCLPDKFQAVTAALGFFRKLLCAAYRSAEAQEHFPKYEHFADPFKEQYFERILEKAAMGAITDIQPFQLEDQPAHEGIEDAEVEWALDGLKEENYADYDPPENDVDDSGEYVPPRDTATKKSIDEVDKDEGSNEERAPKVRRTGENSDFAASQSATK